METVIHKTKDYTITQVDKSTLGEIAAFVVMENYRHHHHNLLSDSGPTNMEDEIQYIYNEELEYNKDETSLIYVVRDLQRRMLGCIRTCRWNGVSELPIQKVFGINPCDVINLENHSSLWHIGRFAINSFCNIPTMILFKKLMVLAIQPVVNVDNSCMIAEADSHLLRVMNALGIKTKILGSALTYLASETLPICSSQSDLFGFYNRQRYLLMQDCNVKDKIPTSSTTQYSFVM